MSDTDASKTNQARAGDRLPLLSFLGRAGDRRGGADDGFVGALIIGALALVVALMALTIAIGRTPQQAVANPGQTASAEPTPAVVTTYPSPEQTGKSWTAEPIIVGVPQKPPSYEPTPSSPTPSATTAEEPPATTAAPPNQPTQEPGQAGEATVVGRPGQTNR